MHIYKGDVSFFSWMDSNSTTFWGLGGLNICQKCSLYCIGLAASFRARSISASLLCLKKRLVTIFVRNDTSREPTPIAIEMPHSSPERGSTLNIFPTGSTTMMTTWHATVMTHTEANIQPLKIPEKTLSSSLILLALISLKSCIQIKVLNTIEFVFLCSSSWLSIHSCSVCSGSHGETLKASKWAGSP